MTEENPSLEQIASHYSAMLDSVNLINEVLENPEDFEDTDGIIQRNVDHLEIMKSQTWWTDEDFTAVDKAITDGSAALSTE